MNCRSPFGRAAREVVPIWWRPRRPASGEEELLDTAVAVVGDVDVVVPIDRHAIWDVELPPAAAVAAPRGEEAGDPTWLVAALAARAPATVAALVALGIVLVALLAELDALGGGLMVASRRVRQSNA
jgi:hypothetical protein